MPLKMIRDDLANVRADAVVLPANEHLVIDGGAGGSVARKAGSWRLHRECKRLGGCAVGSAVAAPAFSFPAKHLIFAVGPRWGSGRNDKLLLRQAYDAALDLSAQLGCESVALPLLSAGAFGCPAEVSLQTALESIESSLETADIEITLVLFDKASVAASLDFLPSLESRIDDAQAESTLREVDGYFARALADIVQEDAAAPAEYGTRVQERPSTTRPSGTRDAALAPASKDGLGKLGRPRADAEAPWPSLSADSEPFAPAAPAARTAPAAHADFGQAPSISAPRSLEERVQDMEAGFSQTLLKLIDESGMTDTEVYRRANMSRQHFSKIRSNAGYRPSKPTVLALCVALRLDLDQTRDLLERAGFALSHASKFDIIVEYFIEQGVYNQITINEALFYFDQALLGG